MWVVNVENVVWLHLIMFNSSDSQDDVPSQYLVADSETDSIDAFINDFEEHMIN